MHPPTIADGVLGDLAGYMRATPAAKRVARSICTVHCIFAFSQRKNNWVIQDIIVSRIPNNSGAHTIFRARSHALMMHARYAHLHAAVGEEHAARFAVQDPDLVRDRRRWRAESLHRVHAGVAIGVVRGRTGPG